MIEYDRIYGLVQKLRAKIWGIEQSMFDVLQDECIDIRDIYYALDLLEHGKYTELLMGECRGLWHMSQLPYQYMGVNRL